MRELHDTGTPIYCSLIYCEYEINSGLVHSAMAGGVMAGSNPCNITIN